VTFQATQPKSAYRHLFMLHRVSPIALTETSPAETFEWTAEMGYEKKGGIKAALPHRSSLSMAVEAGARAARTP
jgi:hypothetical protein